MLVSVRLIQWDVVDFVGHVLGVGAGGDFLCTIVLT
jgi:hypothetical protein